MTEWLRLALEPSIVRRATRFAIIVGSILAAISHGDALIAGTVTVSRARRMGLTCLVPNCVSTFSSISAIRRVSVAAVRR
jgi:hypothetical protein